MALVVYSACAVPFTFLSIMWSSWIWLCPMLCLMLLFAFIPDSESVHAAGRSKLWEAEDRIRATGAACKEIRQLAPLADAYISLVHLHQYDLVHPHLSQTQVMRPDSDVWLKTHARTHARAHTESVCKRHWREVPGSDSKYPLPFVAANMVTVSALTLIPVPRNYMLYEFLQNIKNIHYPVMRSLPASHFICSLREVIHVNSVRWMGLSLLGQMDMSLSNQQTELQHTNILLALWYASYPCTKKLNNLKRTCTLLKFVYSSE